MKKLLLIGALGLMSMGAFAQKGNDKTPEQKAKKASTFMQRKLALTDDQKSMVYQALVERLTKLQELRSQDLDKSAMLQQSKPIRDSFNERMKTTLTPAQYTQWEQLKSDRKAKMGKMKGEKKKEAVKPDSLGDVD